MSYRLEPAETLSDGIKRIAKEQIDQALEQFWDCPEGRNEAVHDARKRFKKIRAVSAGSERNRRRPLQIRRYLFPGCQPPFIGRAG
jgi:hypothetical protein